MYNAIYHFKSEYFLVSPFFRSFSLFLSFVIVFVFCLFFFCLLACFFESILLLIFGMSHLRYSRHSRYLRHFAPIAPLAPFAPALAMISSRFLELEMTLRRRRVIFVSLFFPLRVWLVCNARVTHVWLACDARVTRAQVIYYYVCVMCEAWLIVDSRCRDFRTDVTRHAFLLFLIHN